MSELSEDYIVRLSDGLGIRRYRKSDAQVLGSHADNENVARYMRDRFPRPYTLSDSERWIAHCNEPQNWIKSGEWSSEHGAIGNAIPVNYAITVNGEACGSIGLEPGSDVYFRTAELGYWLGEAHWGARVMSRIVPAFVAWTWATFGIYNRLNAETSADNKGSAKVLTKAGFVFEGRREQAIYKNGKEYALLMFGAVRNTYQGERLGLAASEPLEASPP